MCKFERHQLNLFKNISVTFLHLHGVSLFLYYTYMAYKLEGLLCPFEVSHTQSNSLLNEKKIIELLKFCAFDNQWSTKLTTF